MNTVGRDENSDLIDDSRAGREKVREAMMGGESEESNRQTSSKEERR